MMDAPLAIGATDISRQGHMEGNTSGNGKYGMLRQAALVGLATLVVISGLVTTVPQQTMAIGGTITLGPGQWFNITVGFFEVDQLILWQVFVTGRSPNYADWLERPDGTHVALSPERWGVV